MTIHVSIASIFVLFWAPFIPISFQYEIDEENLLPVHYGNLIKPSDAEKQPLVTFDSNIKLIANVVFGFSLKEKLLINGILTGRRKKGLAMDSASDKSRRPFH